ncbi:hypothetical protein ACHAXM_003237 [Skeletonema potamos]
MVNHLAVIVSIIILAAARVDQASSSFMTGNTHHYHHRRRCCYHRDSAASSSWKHPSKIIIITTSSSSSLKQSLPKRRRQDKLRLHGASSSSKEGGRSSLQITDLTSLRKLLSQATSLHDKNLNSTLPYNQIKSRLHDLEIESSNPTFWDVSNSKRNEMVTKEIARYGRLKTEMELWDRLRNDAIDALDLLEELLLKSNNSNNNNNSNSNLDGDDDDEEMISLTQQECQSSAQQLLQLSQKYELSTLLSGPYDNSSCRLLLTAGAGGTEACDWVSMLYRMYVRHASYMDYTVRVVDESVGEVVGYKSIELVIDGPLAYGWFKGEKGAHRLVRLSPFNANNKRQTTFAGVDVIPVLDEEEIKMVDIPDKELEITTMRSGGKGGQNVNKVETGVRIKHVPSGLAVKCTEERNQLMNKQIALNRLKAQLLAIAQEQRLKDINAIRGDIVEASWGAQIRNYVMQPYKMVKDGRSEWETSDVDGVLDGGAALEEFVGAYLRWMRAKEEKEREEIEL